MHIEMYSRVDQLSNPHPTPVPDSAMFQPFASLHPPPAHQEWRLAGVAAGTRLHTQVRRPGEQMHQVRPDYVRTQDGLAVRPGGRPLGRGANYIGMPTVEALGPFWVVCGCV
jgi:hypothetical protein